jgi:hypothetical protein
MADIQNRLLDFFKRIPLPSTACQFSSRYLSGVCLSSQDQKIRSHFVSPLGKGIVVPSFYKKNITDAPALEQILGEGMARLNPGGRKVVFLLPELSQKVFVFTFDSLPPSPEEKKELIRFRVKKQMPLLPRDARMAFETIASQDGIRVVATVAKAAVIREYEDLFQKLKFKVALAGVSSLSLLSLLGPKKEKDFILLDVEEDSFSLLAVTDGLASLYRQKPFGINAGGGGDAAAKADNILQEVVNTLNFIRDKEKKQIASVWLRLGILQAEDGLSSRMEERLALPLRRIESSIDQEIEDGGKRILSPLIGQIT